MDPKLWELLRKRDENGDEEIEAIIRLDKPQNEVSGLRIVSRFGPIATCRLKKKEIISTREAENVVSLKAAVRIAPEKEPDDSYGQFHFPRNINQNRLRRPRGLYQKGAGVVIGIVDFGCDFNHPDLKNEDGSTRLLALWHQGGNGSTGIENKFGYGTIFTRKHIDRALSQHDPYRALGYQPGVASHGTHVTGIAAGNGMGGGPEGVAPEADIVFVHLASKGTGGLSNLGNSVRLLEAIDFVIEIAQNRPWVINLSVGLHGGPHDGCTPVEMALDHLLLEGSNRFIVQSTGNYFNKDIHASGRLKVGEVRALKIIIDETDQTPNELEVWYAADDAFMVRTESPTGTRSKWVSLGNSSEVLENGRIVGMLYNRKKDPNNSDHLINLFLDPIASPGLWIVYIKALKVSNGVYHAWLERDDCPGCQPRFVANQSNKFYTTGTLANGHIPLVVGAYNAYSPNREVPPFSSVGPTRDNRPKPDCVAPGKSELSARSDSNPDKWNSEQYIRKSGTSMAAPHVTGAVALCLQASSRPLNCYEIRELILNNTEKISNNVRYPIRYGHGYLDIAKAVKSTLALSIRSKAQKEYSTFGLKKEVYPEKTDIMKEKINEVIAEIDNLLVLSILEASKINLFTEIMQPLQSSKNIISLSADELYENIVYKRNGQISETVAENFEVLALPGKLLAEPPRKGDLLLRVALGEPGLGHLAMVSESKLRSYESLIEATITPENQQFGFYATVIEGGSFPHTLSDSFARRILNPNGTVPSGQILIRPILIGAKKTNSEPFDTSVHKVFEDNSIPRKPRLKERCKMRHFNVPSEYKVLEDQVKKWIATCVLSRTRKSDGKRFLREEGLVHNNPSLKEVWLKIKHLHKSEQKAAIEASYTWVLIKGIWTVSSIVFLTNVKPPKLKSKVKTINPKPENEQTIDRTINELIRINSYYFALHDPRNRNLPFTKNDLVVRLKKITNYLTNLQKYENLSSTMREIPSGNSLHFYSFKGIKGDMLHCILRCKVVLKSLMENYKLKATLVNFSRAINTLKSKRKELEIAAGEAVSYELGNAPVYHPYMKSSFKDMGNRTKSELRVLAWLKHNRNIILQAEKTFNTDRRAVAAAIAWEGTKQIKRGSLRGVGPGKMHIYSNLRGALPYLDKGEAIPQQLEKAGYLKKPKSDKARKRLMETPVGAITYISAAMQAATDIVHQETGGACNIKHDLVALTSFYQAYDLKSWLSHIRKKIKKSSTKQCIFIAGNPMAKWTKNNIAYLESVLGKP